LFVRSRRAQAAFFEQPVVPDDDAIHTNLSFRTEAWQCLEPFRAGHDEALVNRMADDRPADWMFGTGLERGRQP
jgi:hypothetical protein